MKKVAIIDYGMGNLRSIEKCLNYLGIENKIIDDPKNLKNFTHIILPGVGSFKKAISNLKKNNMYEAIIKISRNKKKKILGICLGMQLLFKSSTEDGITKGLGIIEGKVDKFLINKKLFIKIPHVGFNEVYFEKNNIFFEGIKNKSDFYFDHSYKVSLFSNEINPVLTEYGENFLSAFNSKNIFGAQFHPEKSQSNGLLIIQNFIKN
jgi:glutamine amidotransferase